MICVHFMMEGASATTLDLQATSPSRDAVHNALFEKKSRLGLGSGEAIETEMQT